jgi:TRAP-type C4-dicarboxylate transport system permease small subunit
VAFISAVERLEAIEARIAAWSRNIAILGVIALLVVASSTLLDVLFRWVANSPIRGLNDINGLAVPVVIAACFPLVVARRHNISIRLLGEAIGPSVCRWLDVFGAALLLIFVALVGWQLVVYTLDLARSNRTTWQLLVPVTPTWSVATTIVLLCIPIQVAALATDIARAVAGISRESGEEISVT